MEIRLMNRLDVVGIQRVGKCRRYELCSEYGLYVVDEANVESHGFDGSLVSNDRQLTNDTAWCARHVR